MRLWLIKSFIFVLALIGLIRFEAWYFTEKIDGIVLQIDNQDRVLLAQNLELEEDAFNRTYMEWFLGDYEVIEVTNLGNVEPGMHISVAFDSRRLLNDGIRVQATEYEVLEMAFSVLETTIPTFSDHNEKSELAQIFPRTEGHFQVFNGYADYGHIQKLTQIRENENNIEIYFEGQMNDANEFAENRRFNIMYLIDETSIVEFIHNRDDQNSLNHEALFHSIIERKVILKAPLEIGNTWEQLFSFNGRQYTAITEIVRVEKNENGKMEYETVTRVDGIEGFYDNYYEERRIFVEGSGMTNFTNRQSFEQLGLTSESATETGNIFIFGFSLAIERQEQLESSEENRTNNQTEAITDEINNESKETEDDIAPE